MYTGPIDDANIRRIFSQAADLFFYLFSAASSFLRLRTQRK